ncbi:MAG: M28 family peptidase [Candidatus Aureabacteria bacterium]|nr:M28 family peptidase [Candidatus Auribacterota bacterium]
MRIILVALAVLVVSLLPGYVGSEPSLFLMENPNNLSLEKCGGVEVWTRFWAGDRELAVISIPPSARDQIEGLGVPTCSIGAAEEGGSFFVITSPAGKIDLPLLSAYAEVLRGGGNAALVRMDPGRVGDIARHGLEAMAVMPPSGRAPASSIRTEYIGSRSFDPLVGEIMARVDQQSLWDLLGMLSGDNSVTVSGEPYTILTRNSFEAVPIEKATQYCIEYLQSLGLSVSFQYYPLGTRVLRNVVAEQPGTVHPGDSYVLCAHLDDMPDGALAPGADDNGSGAAALLTAASILKGYSFENTIRYALFTGEEQGLVGSYYYVQNLVNSGARVLGALNCDMISYDGNSDGIVEVHCGTSQASSSLGDFLIDTIRQYSINLTAEKFTAGATGGSDHVRFWEAGYPALLMIEDGGGGDSSDFNPYYHTVEDTRTHCNSSYVTDCVRAVTGTVARVAVPVEYPLRPTLVINAAPPSPAAGERFTLGLGLERDIVRMFDFYLIAETPYGEYTLFFDGSYTKQLVPLYRGVPGYRAPYAVTIWNGVTVPQGIAGNFTFYAVAVEAGEIPPVASVQDLSAGTPYVIALARQQVTFR